MSRNELIRLRLFSQQLVASSCTSVDEVVRWMGAIQAQDYEMAKWGIGIRLPGATEPLIEQAIDEARIIRTHLLRPTWHFVAATDIHWLLDLTAPHVRSSIGSMNRKLELDEAVFKKSNAVIEQALEGNTYLTREELMQHLQEAGIRTDDIRSAHLMFEAELSGLVCSGPRRTNPRGSKQFTYALLRERVSLRRTMTRDEALAELATRYFTSHGPATLKDFAWWSGLTIIDSKKAIEIAKQYLQSVSIDSRVYWLAKTVEGPLSMPEPIHLLPAFDEFMISYSDRTASLAPEFAAQTNTGNGIFRPIIIINGQVVGVWKRTLKPKTVAIDLTFFYPLPSDLVERVRERANQYANYTQTRLLVLP